MNKHMKWVVIPREELMIDAGYYGGYDLIQCKDCKHWRKHSLTDKHFCELVTTPTKSYWVSKAEDYCSRAEWRKDE